MDIKQFENKRWGNFDSEIGFRHKAALEMISKGSVLDLGAGDGILLGMLKSGFENKKGLDISEEAVKKAKDKDLEVDVFDLAMNKLPYEDGSFDSVVMLDVLEHLYNPADVLKESVRVSRRHLIVGVPNFNSLPARIHVLLGRIPENNTPRKGHIYWFNLGVLNKMLELNRLKIVDIKINTFWQYIPVVNYCVRFLSKKFPSIFALSFVIKAEKQ